MHLDLERIALALQSAQALIDPYAKQLVGSLKWGPELFGYTLEG